MKKVYFIFTLASLLILSQQSLASNTLSDYDCHEAAESAIGFAQSNLANNPEDANTVAEYLLSELINMNSYIVRSSGSCKIFCV